ncbi:MAG: alpha-L-arabinofuranosidase C-terminal domain-containing protein [Myxococcota bacterium]|nr:alpha-L-arabinofuranosidase C-terminal domain-containing protein [Myxococcota bacterium]
MKKTLVPIAAVVVGIMSGIAPVGAQPQSGSNQAGIVIDTDAPAKKYDPMIFGGFIEHLGRQIYGGFFEPGSPLADKKGFRLDVIKAIKELKTPVIRWPGGCFVDSYHWRKGVGEVRQPYDDDRWGVREPNTFGTQEFVELCRRLGAEPYICQNSLASIQEMADWVAYCNAKTGELAEMRRMNGSPEPFNVRFWSVGNEKGGRGYINKVRDTAVAMKQVDPGVLVTCSGAHGPRARIDPYLFETAGKYLNLLSIHEYWVANFQEHQAPDYLSCVMLSEKPDAHISAIVKSIDEAGMRGRIKIAFDEWNLRSWHHPGFSGHHARKVDYRDPAVMALIKARDKSLNPSLYTMADALFCSSFFNACLRHADDVTMANISCLVNQTGPLYVHPKGIVKRAHFHAMAMYANLLQARVARTQINADRLTHGTASVAMVDAIATVDESGKKWAVAIMNRHPSEDVACTLKIAQLPINGTYKATVLTGESPDSYNDIGHPHRVVPRETELTFKKGAVRLPPHSLVIVDVLSTDR